MAEVVWVRRATRDLVEAVAYIEQDDPNAAALMGERLFALGQSLSRSPRRGRPAKEGTRELVIIRPYIIRYRVNVDDTVVTILSVRHSRRQPL